MRIVFAGMSSVVLLLAACSQELESNAADEAAPGLGALTIEDIGDAELSGELGCSFSSLEGDLLLVAMGIVASEEAAEGLIRVDESTVLIEAPGGFNGIVHGATFAGEGYTVQIEITGEAEGGGESPPRPANVTLDANGRDSQVISGRWECGP